MPSADLKDTVETVFRTMMEFKGTPVTEMDHNRDLFDGYGLESMDTALLSGMLTEALEDDPYSRDIVPRTLGEIIAWYEAARG